MKTIARLAANDLRLTLRDRASAFWLLIFPVGLMWFFGAMGGGDASTPQIGLDVVDHDNAWLSAALIEELQDDRIRLEVVDPDATEAGDEEETPRRLVIPEGFTQGVMGREPQSLRLENRSGASGEFSLAARVHVTRVIARTLGRLIELDRTPGALDDPEAARVAFEALRAREPAVRLEVSAAGAGRPMPSGRAQSVPGMLTFMVLMMTSIYGAVFLTIEKRTGMLRRQSVPVNRRSLFLGKLVGRVLIAGMQVVVLLIAGTLLGVSWGGSFLGLLLVLGSFTLAVASFSTMLGALLRTPEQASAIGWIASMVMAALGGCWWPSEVMPEWLRSAALVFPTTWAMDGFHELISFGSGVAAVWIPTAVLALFALVFSALGARFLRVEA